MRARIQAAVTEWARDFEAIPPERRAALDRMSAFVAERSNVKASIPLMFICTHNSRRSHFAQLWAAAAATHYRIPGVQSYSGGTEVTAFNPRAVAAMERAGFRVDNPGGENPRYRVWYADDADPIECFSKVYDDPYNPTEGFLAVMTCSSADDACPVVLGASVRVSIPYDDPKVSDGTPAEAETYDARCRQIATEILYVFSRAS